MAAPSMPWSCSVSRDARRAGVCPRHYSTSISTTLGVWLVGIAPLDVAALAMKRGKVAADAPAPLGVGSVTPGEETVSLFFKATSAAVGGSLGATAVSSETVTTSLPFALLALYAGAATSLAFLFREGSSSVTTGGTLAREGWPIFLTPVL